MERVRGPGVEPFEEVRDRLRAMYVREELERQQVRITQELRRRARVEMLVK